MVWAIYLCIRKVIVTQKITAPVSIQTQHSQSHTHNRVQHTNIHTHTLKKKQERGICCEEGIQKEMEGNKCWLYGQNIFQTYVNIFHILYS